MLGGGESEQRRTVVVDIAMPSDCKIRKKEEENLEALQEELKKAWRVKLPVEPVVLRAWGQLSSIWRSDYSIS